MEETQIVIKSLLLKLLIVVYISIIFGNSVAFI